MKVQLSASDRSSSLAMFCTRTRAATATSLLGRNGWACGFNSAGCGRGLSQESSKGYNCWTARSMRDFPERNTPPLTIPSVPTMTFSTMPSGHLPLFLSSARTITTSPMAGAFPWAVAWPRCFSRRLRRYSFDQRRHTASLHLRTFALIACEQRCCAGNATVICHASLRLTGPEDKHGVENTGEKNFRPAKLLFF